MGRPVLSLRGRIARWIAAVLGTSLLASSAVRVAVERRRVLESERSGAASFLGRLVRNPELLGSVAEARSQLERLDPLVGPWRAQVDVVPRGTPAPPGSTVLVSDVVRLRDGVFELRYLVSSSYMSQALRRTIIFHALTGVLTFVVIMAGIEWILRRRLRGPLHQLAHQLEHMRDGGGWQPVLPPTDAECAEIAAAVRELGPGLAGQVETWIEGEKRAAVATALGRVRKGLLDLRRRHVPRAGDVHRPVREITRELGAVARLVDSVEDDMLQVDGRRGSVVLPSPVSARARRAASSDGGAASAKGRPKRPPKPHVP